MGKTIVLYRSEYGYTKTYAEMIAKELGCDIREASGVGRRIEGNANSELFFRHLSH